MKYIFILLALLSLSACQEQCYKIADADGPIETEFECFTTKKDCYEFIQYATSNRDDLVCLKYEGETE